LCDSPFAYGATDEAVHAVLEVVDLFDAGDFRFVEFLCSKMSAMVEP
jgi:hypothetical protein